MGPPSAPDSVLLSVRFSTASLVALAAGLLVAGSLLAVGCAGGGADEASSRRGKQSDLPSPVVDLSPPSPPPSDPAAAPALDPLDWQLPDPKDSASIAPWFRLFYIQDNRAEMNACGCPGSPTGGLARRAAFVQDLRFLFSGALVVEGPTALSRAAIGIETIRGVDRQRGRALLEFIAQCGPAAFFPGQADFEVVPLPDLLRLAQGQGLPVVATNVAAGSGTSTLRTRWEHRVGDRRVLVLGLVRSPEKEGLRTQLPLMDAVKAVNRELREAAEEGSIDLVVAFTDADLRERKRWLSQGLDVDVLLVAPERDRDRGDHWDDGLFQLRSEPLGRAFRRLDVLFSGPAGRGLHSPSELESSLRRVVAMEELYLLRRSDLSLAEAEGAPEGGTALPPGMDGQPRIDRSRDPESLRGAMASAKASRRKALGPLRGAKTRGHLAVAGRWTIREGLVPDPKIEAAIASHQEDRMAQLKVLVAEPAGGAAIEQPFGSQDQCIDCHAPLLASWARSPHAQAWLHLRERGETRNPDCLPCHTTGFGQVGGFVDPAADRTLLNVQCEACHGPMELHALKAAHPGFRPPAGSPVTSKTCEGCHDKANSPNFDCRSYLRMLPHPVLGPGWEETAAEVCGP